MISIILPVKNEEKYLADCLDSIQSQTHQNWQLIVIDDHSTDSTAEIIKESRYSADTRIIYISNESDGVISALKTGVKHCTGDYITRMDGDDIMPPKRLSLMKNALAKCNQPSLVSGLVQYFGEMAISEGYKRYETWLNEVQLTQSHSKQVYRECFFASANWMMKTEDFFNIGGFEDLSLPEDYAFALQCHDKGIQFIGLPETTLLWRHHADRTSLTHPGYHQKAFFELKINHFISNSTTDRPLILWGRNQKTKLTTKILDRAQRRYVVYKMNQFTEIEKYQEPLLLITVYPSLRERKQMRTYLSNLKLEEGKDYWFV